MLNVTNLQRFQMIPEVAISSNVHSLVNSDHRQINYALLCFKTPQDHFLLVYSLSVQN